MTTYAVALSGSPGANSQTTESRLSPRFLFSSSRHLLDLDLHSTQLARAHNAQKAAERRARGGGLAAPAPIFSNAAVLTLPDNPSVSYVIVPQII